MINIVISKYYKSIANTLEESIKEALQKNNLNYRITEVPGVWEIPYEINRLSALSGDRTEFIAVGIVVKGETDHYEYLSSSVVNGLIDITIHKNVYIANCILNLTDIKQADTRAKTKGVEAVNSLIKIQTNKKKFPS